MLPLKRPPETEAQCFSVRLGFTALGAVQEASFACLRFVMRSPDLEVPVSQSGGFSFAFPWIFSVIFLLFIKPAFLASLFCFRTAWQNATENLTVVIINQMPSACHAVMEL